MGIVLTVVVIVALLIVARAALKDYEAEVRRSPKTVHPDSSLYTLLPPEDSSSGTIPHGHAGHHADFGCADAHHSGCDIGGHGGFDGGHGGYGGHH
jgi:hypothetical protein